MALIHETFDGGLVTARDPSTLNPGEVQRAINAIYRPSSPGLWKAPGRASYNATPLVASAKGLRYLRFNGGGGTPVEILVTHVEDDYYSTTFDDESGAFASLATAVGTGNTLESVHYANRHYLFNGNSDSIANTVVKLSESTLLPITRTHGLLPVTQVPTLASAAGAGWPDTTDFGTGVYYFFYTEIVNPDGPDEIESAIADSLTPPNISIANFTNGVLLTFPSTADNATATHRRIYVVGPLDSTIWSAFNLVTAREVATIDIAQTTITLGGAIGSTEENKVPASTAGSVNWTNPDGIIALDSSYAVTSTANAALIARDFNFLGGYAAIQGIEIIVRMKQPKPWNSLAVALSWNGGASWTSPVKISTYPPHTNYFLYVKAGARNYLWGRTWAASEFTNANFRVRLTRVDGGTNVSVNTVSATVAYGSLVATEIRKLGYYPTTSVMVGPTVTVLSSNTPPPIASTGDIYEAQLVLNDVSADATIRWSRVDEPDYFPTIYTLTFPVADKITVIRRINNVLLIGMEQHIWRVNFLPTTADSTFETGRSYEPIAEDHGIISTQGYAFFAPDGMSAQLGYVSASGLRYTNGLTTSILTEDLDWPNTINITKLDKCILVNDPILYSLIFYYIPAGDTTSTAPTRALYLSYHPSKMKEGGKLAVAGPVTVNVASSTIGFVNKRPIHLTGSTAGTVSVEDRGEGSAEMDILTRDIYPDAIGGSFRARAHWLRYAANDPGVTIIITPFLKNAGKDYYTPADNGQWSQKSFRNNTVSRIPGDTLTLRNTGGLARLAGDFSAESFALRIQSEAVVGQANGGVAISAYGFDAKSQGEKEV